jgi:hypothetical protein
LDALGAASAVSLVPLFDEQAAKVSTMESARSIVVIFFMFVPPRIWS